MREQHYPSGARHMPIENDFTRVFGAIRELEERVERLEGKDLGVYAWGAAHEPDKTPNYIPTPDCYSERMSARDAMIDDNYADALYAQNNQLRFVLSILAAVKDDGWIEWNGGECPVMGLTVVDFQSRCGDALYGYGEIASDLTWEHVDGPWDIIAYRIAR